MKPIDPLTKKITKGIKKAVKKAIQEHFNSGHYIVISENGKIKKIYPPNRKKKAVKISL